MSTQPYVDFDDYVDFHLNKTRQNIKSTELFTTLGWLATLDVGYLLAFVVADHWLIDGGFSLLPRVLMLAVVLAVTVGVLVWKVILPWSHQISALYAAKAIESADSHLKGNLLNYVDLQQAGVAASPAVAKAMEKRAAVELQKVDVEQAVDRRPLLRAAYVLLGVVVTACLYTVISPKDVLTSMKRALLPMTSTHVATQTIISDVTPGDESVPARTLLTVEADIRGQVPDEVRILVTTADRQEVNQPVEMRRVDEGLPRFRGTISGENGRGVLQNLTYRIVAGDARSPEYTINVVQPPSVKVDGVAYVHPAYMRLENKSTGGGHIEGWEGTEVALTATANMPLKSAKIVFSDTEQRPAQAETESVTITGGTQLTAKWKLAFRADGTYPKFFRIDCATSDNRSDPEPTLYTIKIRPDQPPEVALLSPTGDLQMPANGTVPLLFQATDPDFLLRWITLHAEKDGQPLLVPPEHLLDDGEPRQSVRGSYDFALVPLNLKSGDVIQYWLEATDNRKPSPNSKRTPKQIIKIVDPVTPDEAKQQLAKEKEKQQDQLANADDARNPDRDQPPKPRDDANEKKRDDEVKRFALEVRLFDEELNEELDVDEFAKKLGLVEPYFRGSVLSDCTSPDGKWRASPGARRPVTNAPGLKLPIRQEIIQDQSVEENIETGILHSLPRFGACRLQQPGNQGRIVQVHETSALYRENANLNGNETRYVVHSAKETHKDGVPFPLAILENELPAADRDYFCKLPAGLTDLRKFARQVAKSPDGTIPDQVTVAKRLLERLDQSDFAYDENPSELDGLTPRVDTVEQFLLSSKRGDCKQFNSALALMLRELKIPSRVILGFKGGKVESGKFIVRWPGHAWTEANLNGRWHILDATAGHTADQKGKPRPNKPTDAQKDDQLAQNQPPKEGDNDRRPDQDNQPNGADRKANDKDRRNGKADDETALEKLINKQRERDEAQKDEPKKENDPANDQSGKSGEKDPAAKKSGQPGAQKKDPGAEKKPGDDGQPSDDPADPGAKKSDDPGKSSPNKPGESDPASKKPGQPGAQKKDPGAEKKPGEDGKPSDDPTDPGAKKSDDPSKSSPSKPGESDPASKKPSQPGAQKKDPGAEKKPGDDAKPSDDPTDPGAKKSDDPSNSSPSKPGESDPASKKPGQPGAQKKDPGAEKKPGDDGKPSDDPADPGAKKPDEPGKPDSHKPADQKPGDAKSKTDKQKPGSGKPSDRTTEQKAAKPGDPPTDDKPSNDPSVKPEDRSEKPGKTPDESNDDLKGKGRKDQKSPKSEGGEQGASKKADQGSKGDDKTGKGDKSEQPGDTDPASKKTGQPGSEKKGPGSQKKPSADGKPSDDEGDPSAKKSDQPGKPSASKPKPGEGESGESEKDAADAKSSGDSKSAKSSKSKSGQPGKPGGKSEPSDGPPSKSEGKSSDPNAQPGKPGESAGGKVGGGASGDSSPPGQSGKKPGEGQKPNDADSASSTPDQPEDPKIAEQANLDYARKATNLVLQRLKEQLERGDVDQQLLDELGWTKEDAEKFAKRLEQQLNAPRDASSPEAEARQKQFEELLKSLTVTSSTSRREGDAKRQRRTQQNETRRLTLPPEYRELGEAYSKGLSKAKAGEKTEKKK